MVATKLVTAEELERLPEDGSRYALIRGVLYRMPRPKLLHARVVTRVARFLDVFAEEHDLGVVYTDGGFALARDPDTVVGPDVAFVRRDRVPEDETIFPDLAPDLAVEVLSPSNTPALIAAKIAPYFEAGVRLVWIFDPRRRTVRVRGADGEDRLLREGDELDGGGVLPGFRMPVARFVA